MLGAYRDRRPEPLPPTPGGERPGPWSPLPIGTHAHDEIDPPGPPRFPPACHAMLDGRTARWPRSMQRRPLPGYRQTATSLRHQETRRQPTTPPRSRSRHAMPCHAIPSTPSTVEDHSHTDSPTLTGLESCAQAFRGPNSILRGTQMHTQWATTGQPAKVLRSPPLLSTGEDRSRATSGPGLDYPPSQLAVGHRLGAPSPRDHDAPGPSTSGLGRPPPARVIRSPPMLSTGKGQGRAHWNRTRERGIGPRHLPTTTSHPGPRSRPQRPRPTSGSFSQLATGLRRREAALEHL